MTNDASLLNVRCRGTARERDMSHIENRMYYYYACDILLQGPDESSSGQKESALLSLINVHIQSPHPTPLLFYLAGSTRDHLGQIALGFKSKSLQLSPVCLFMCAQSVWPGWHFYFSL